MSSGGGGNGPAHTAPAPGSAEADPSPVTAVSAVSAARAALNAAIADLAALDTRTTGVEDLLALLIDSDHAARALTGLGQTWLHRSVQAGAFTDTGLTCADALSGLLHIDLPEARTRLRR
ncbi:hypothetical protein, partial [Rhodococcoides corynebacterioides]|uniref:hypothetical protein n=1 Tax=Rhodococcoides corynebacterioides TaxID=53972 RepID=UPI001C9A5454